MTPGPPLSKEITEIWKQDSIILPNMTRSGRRVLENLDFVLRKFDPDEQILFVRAEQREMEEDFEMERWIWRNIAIKLTLTRNSNVGVAISRNSLASMLSELNSDWLIISAKFSSVFSRI